MAAWAGCIAIIVLVVLGQYDKAPGSILTWVLYGLPHLTVTWAGLVFLAWCALPDRRTFPGVLLLMGGGALVLWGPGMAGTSSTAAGPDVRVVSWNVQRLWGEDGATECVVDTLQSFDPDLVALVEVSHDDLARLKSLNLDCSHTPYTKSGGKSRGGVAVCGRNGWEIDGGPRRFVEADDWNFLAAEARKEDVLLNVMAVHLPPQHLGQSPGVTAQIAARQANQSAGLLAKVRALQDPTLIAGDFNSTRDFWLHATLRGHLMDVWERGGLGFGATRFVWGWFPLRIDFLYASQDFAVRQVEVVEASCSDHRPVAAVLRLPSR